MRLWYDAIGFMLIMAALNASLVFADEKPNIVYIMSDELAYYELSHIGNPYIKTPHIEQMAQEGIRNKGRDRLGHERPFPVTQLFCFIGENGLLEKEFIECHNIRLVNSGNRIYCLTH